MRAAFSGEVNGIESAVLLVQACLEGLLKPTTKRLDKNERKQISNGDCFVFVEGETDIKRWTDGKSWGPSRVHDNFLVYKEAEGAVAKKRKDKPLKPNGFKKKCISILVDGKNCHLICYYKEGLVNSFDFKNDVRFHHLRLKPFKVLTTGLSKRSSLDSKFENEPGEETFFSDIIPEYHPMVVPTNQIIDPNYMRSSSTLAREPSENLHTKEESDSDRETLKFASDSDDDLFPRYPSSYLTR